ncbi:MAG: hypothetical protein BWY74_00483 [Firmicutes bacterium ADurb.Bin419]|nr:MAG: hypothetical protein BWY74_00483 [Firmicutes bacterium ADurb.Bin419]
MPKKVDYFLASKKSTERLFTAEKYPGFKSAKPTFLCLASSYIGNNLDG